MFIIIGECISDPDVSVGGYLTLERADGRSVWKQRLVVVQKDHNIYHLKPVDEFGNDLAG